MDDFGTGPSIHREFDIQINGKDRKRVDYKTFRNNIGEDTTKEICKDLKNAGFCTREEKGDKIEEKYKIVTMSAVEVLIGAIVGAAAEEAARRFFNHVYTLTEGELCEMYCSDDISEEALESMGIDPEDCDCPDDRDESLRGYH